MKRMNVREFRKNVSHLDQEPVEVVRYAETIGFWVPRGMTLEPAKKPPVRKLSEKEIEKIAEMISKAMPKK